MLKLLFKRPTLGLISWLLLISFYLATFLNIAFYKQVLQDLPLDSVRNVLVHHEHCADTGLIPVA